MSTTTFKAGDEVYDIHGRAGCYVARTPAGHIVEPAYDDEGETTFDDAQTWREVYAKPPVEKLHADVAAAEAKLNGLHEQARKARTELAAAEALEAAARKRISSNPQLVDLDLWLQGKVTHIVSLDYNGFSIGTVDEVLTKQEDHGRTSIKLLNLRADPKANQYWVGYAAYSDGSSSQTRCLLATSLEHARELAAAYIVKRTRDESEHGRLGLAESAIRYGVQVSDELRAMVEQRRAQAAASSLESARKALAKAQADLTAAEARAAGAAA